MQLLPLVEDKWEWSWESKGHFSTRSVYQAHFKTNITCEVAEAIWKSWAPIKCKLAMWLIIRQRVWTADRLQIRGLPHPDKCPYCSLTRENTQHLFMGCAIINIIWGQVLRWANFHNITLSTHANLNFCSKCIPGFFFHGTSI